MYERKRKINSGDCSMNNFCEYRVRHHSPSFYLRGGVEINRRERLPLQSVPEQSEHISDGTINVLTDPRVSKIDVAVMAAEASIRSKRSEKQVKEL